MLLDHAGANQSQFLAFFYSCSKATWSDGRASGTFSFYGLWEPWINYLAMAIELFDADLGTDESIADHCLLCDRGSGRVYLAENNRELLVFLESQHSPIEPENWEQLGNERPLDALRLQSLNLAQLQDRGMFEFLGQNPRHVEWAVSLTNWLDGQVTTELIQRYVTEIQAGNQFAAIALANFKRRLERSLKRGAA